MRQYIKNLLPRLQQFSNSLDRIENFVDKPWMMEDEMANRQTFIFQRDHSLIASYNGVASIGKWRYVNATQGLLINTGGEHLLLNLAFAVEGVMIMKLDGNKDEPWLLVNQQVIPDLDAERYLREYAIQKLKLNRVKVGDRTYYFSTPNNVGLDMDSVFFDELLEQKGVNIQVKQGELSYRIVEGIVNETYYNVPVKTDKGLLIIQSPDAGINIGYSAVVDGQTASDGDYQLSIFGYAQLTITGGKISHLKAKTDARIYITIVMLLVVATLIFFALRMIE
jgi:hypothetical protein